MINKFALLSMVVLSACGDPPAAEPPQSVVETRTFVDRVWTATDVSAAPGTFRIFLSDGTLVMDSCGETYRLARWRAIDGSRIEWMEDTARIAAEIAQPSADTLQLRLELAAEVRTETYRVAQVPMVCPDMPR